MKEGNGGEGEGTQTIYGTFLTIRLAADRKCSP